MRRSKKYKDLKNKLAGCSTLSEFMDILFANSPYKFDQTVEIKLAVNHKGKNYSPYKISVIYPNTFVKDVKLLTFVDEQEADKVISFGSDYAGLERYISKIMDEHWLDFDYALATPEAMPKIVKLGKVLGSRGLMPNPKNGTVVSFENLEKAIKEFKSGRLMFSEDKTNVIHIVVGKISQGKESVYDNIRALFRTINEAFPGLHSEIKSLHIKATMSPAYEASYAELSSI